MSDLTVDVVIFGGGVAGLWTLDQLHRAGRSVLLLEAFELGHGQTIASQGIIHGGLKYTLGGFLSPSASAIAEMPLIWRRCLAGEANPNLTHTRLRAAYCHLWRTASIKSRLGMMGARAGLRVAPVTISDGERPPALAGCPGPVARLDEQVIDPSSFLYDLFDHHRSRIIRVDASNGVEFDLGGQAQVRAIRMINPETGDPLDLIPRDVVLAAGLGNEPLRQSLGLPSGAMQRRPLHMTLVRGDLPELNGHCIDGSATRVTITTARDYEDRIVWQVGGQAAELGVHMRAAELVAHVRNELQEVLPGVQFTGLDWATYRIDRAEPATRSGMRPENAFVDREGNVITAWPAKLALAPRLAALVLERLNSGSPATDVSRMNTALRQWPRPSIALPPWERINTWFQDPLAAPA